LGGRENHNQVGRVRLVQEDADEDPPGNFDRFRTVQVEQGQERSQQDPRQGCRHQEEQDVQSWKIIK
jgi:hypothetical protein